MKLTDIAVEATTDGYLKLTEGDANPIETQDRLIFSLECRAVPLYSGERGRSQAEEALKLIAEAAPGDDIAGCLDACKSIASKALSSKMGAGWAESAYGAPEPGYDKP